MKNNQLTVGLLILVIAGASFFGGMKYQESKVIGNRQFGNGNTQNRAGAGGQGIVRMGGAGGSANRMGGQILGEIISADDKSITVKLADGSSKIILLSTTTSIIKSSEANKTDLTTGTKVGVFGQTNTDGSVTAQNIQLNPVSRAFGATPSATPTK